MTNSLRRRAAFATVVIAVATFVTACVAVPGEPAQSPTPGATIAALYGDSYTRGTGASSPERRWSTIVCAERGWFEFNPSVDGIGT